MRVGSLAYILLAGCATNSDFRQLRQEIDVVRTDVRALRIDLKSAKEPAAELLAKIEGQVGGKIAALNSNIAAVQGRLEGLDTRAKTSRETMEAHEQRVSRFVQQTSQDITTIETKKDQIRRIAEELEASYSRVVLTEYGWAGTPARIPVATFLGIWFRLSMEREGGSSLNDYSVVRFSPAESPAEAIVVVTQAWRDKQLPPVDLRRRIREMSAVELDVFRARMRDVRRYWNPPNPDSNLIIQHVRYSDNGETLGVTVGGVARFDQDSIDAARTLVKSRGGFWFE